MIILMIMNVLTMRMRMKTIPRNICNSSRKCCVDKVSPRASNYRMVIIPKEIHTDIGSCLRTKLYYLNVFEFLLHYER